MQNRGYINTHSNVQAKRKKEKILSWIFLLFFIIFIFGLFTYLGQIKKVNTEIVQKEKNVLTQKDKEEELEIINKIQAEILNKNIFQKNILFINKKKLEENLKKEFNNIDKIEIGRKLNMSLKVLVYKHNPAFFSCDRNEEFLISCMTANLEGVYYEEFKESNLKLFEIETDKKNLRNRDESLIKEEIDSFASHRLLTKNDIKLITELKKYFEKENYKISKIKINELGVVSFMDENFYISTNINKNFVEMVGDYETLKKSVEFGKNLQSSIVAKENLEYLDLSFKNKVFYKLRN